MLATVEDRPKLEEIGFRSGLIESNPDHSPAQIAEIVAGRARRLQRCLAVLIAQIYADRVEERDFRDMHLESLQTLPEQIREAMHSLGDRLQTARAVIHGIHRRDHGEEDLGRANVTGGFVAADVLLARLKREAISRATGSVVRNADQATRKVALVSIARGHIPGMRTASAEGHAEALRVADGNICAEFPGRAQHRQAEDIGRDNGQRAGLMRLCNKIFVIVNRAGG